MLSYVIEDLSFESLQEQEMYLFSGLRPTLRPTKWATEVFSPEQYGQSPRLTIHLHLAPKLRMSGALFLLLLDVLMVCVGKDKL
jgi:hypothetical protein